MSTVRGSRPHGGGRKDDPFFYGYRDVYGKPGGWQQIPLTEEDVLHPQEGDHIANNDAHSRDVSYLTEVCRATLEEDPTVVVLSDVNIYWDDPRRLHHCPDVAVIAGLRERRNWRSFMVAEEGVRPSLLIEVSSPSTRNVDLRRKRAQYYRCGVPNYVIVDEESERGGVRQLRLLSYRQGPRFYVSTAPDEHGRVWLEAVGMWLGIEDGRVACYDTQGRRQGDYPAVLRGQTEARLEAERSRQEAERARQEAERQSRERAEAEHRATEAEARNRSLEEELRRLRGD